MKKFLIYSLKIVLITFVLLYASDLVYTAIYEHSIPRNKLQYLVKKEQQEYDIAFLGSSRVANHINTQLFDSLSGKKTINLGVEGAGLNDNLLQLKLLLSKNKVKSVYLQLDPNFENVNPSNLGTVESMPFIKNREINTHLQENFEDYWKLNYVPFYRYAINDPKIGFREAIFSAINKKPRIDPSIGYTPKYKSSGKLVGQHLPKTIKNNNPVLDSIEKICARNAVELVYYISPYCSKTKNLNYIEKLKSKIPSIIDLTEGYPDSLFYNCAHLNDTGAGLFTENLYLATKSL